MKTQKKLKPRSPRLPGLTPVPAEGGQLGTTRRFGESRTTAGRLGSAMRDASSSESAKVLPKTETAKRGGAAGLGNEVGRTAKATSANGSTKKSSATKPIMSVPQRPANEVSKADVDSASFAGGMKKGPRVSVLLGQEGTERRKAESRVKSSRIKQAGIESRLLGHVSSTVKRAQARRDSKN